MNKKEAKKFLKFCIRYYRLEYVVINLEFIKKDTGNRTAYVAVGEPGEYDIVINKAELKRVPIEYSIAHEITHIWQECVGLLNWRNPDIYKWKGEWWDVDENDPVSYFFTPWEIQARMMEEPLAYFYATGYEGLHARTKG